MTSKHWTLVGGAVACLITSAYSSTAFAAPWLEPGDNRARFALQKLADRGHLDRTASTWPVMMGTVHSGLSQETGSDAPAIGGPLAYLKFEMRRPSHHKASPQAPTQSIPTKVLTADRP